MTFLPNPLLNNQVNRIDDHELVDLIMAKGRGSQRKEFPKFWPEVGELGFRQPTG